MELSRTASPGAADMARPVATAYRRDIDGLRAIAVTSVVFYHAGLWPLSSGYVGVDIFFVISGFLIGGILNREIRSGSFSFARFYARRARRILPALLTVTILVCAASLFLMGSRELRQTGLSAATALVGISNVYFWWSTNYFAPAAHLNPFLMTWSLGVEEQFYIVFPFVLMALSRLSQKASAIVIALLSILSFIICVAVTAYNPTAAFYLIPMRAWELGVGALLALLWPRITHLTSVAAHNMIGIAGLAATIIACLVFDDATPFPGVAAALPVAGTVALLIAERGWVNRVLLSSRPMVGIGLLSYSWYLWHAPVMALLRLVTFGNATVAMLCAMAFMSLAFAYLSWRFVERPFRHAGAQDGPTLRRYGVAMALCLALPVAFALGRGLPQRLGTHGMAVERTLSQGRGNPCLVSYGVTEPSPVPGCSPPVAPGRRGAILLGDSHAGALGQALGALAAAQGVGFHQYEKSSCAPLLGATRAMPKYPEHGAQCAAFNETMFRRIGADKTIDTVILAGFWSASFQGEANDGTLIGTTPGMGGSQAEILRTALVRTIDRYRAAGKRVVLLGDVPLMRFDPGKEAIGDILPVRDRLRHWLGVPADVRDGYAGRRWLRPTTQADTIVAQVATETPGVTYFAPADRLCDATRCIYGADIPNYIDFQHLSKPGAAYALADLKL
jgi:peptidoglycan/LPS O-acetylase OafA/YrhL